MQELNDIKRQSLLKAWNVNMTFAEHIYKETQRNQKVKKRIEYEQETIKSQLSWRQKKRGLFSGRGLLTRRPTEYSAYDTTTKRHQNN